LSSSNVTDAKCNIGNACTARIDTASTVAFWPWRRLGHLRQPRFLRLLRTCLRTANFTCIKQKSPAVAREDVLQPMQFLLKYTVLQGHPRSIIFISSDKAYAISY